MIRMNKIIGILLLMLISMSMFAQQNVDSNQLSIDGNWEIIFDDKNQGVKGEWHLNRNYENHQGTICRCPPGQNRHD